MELPLVIGILFLLPIVAKSFNSFSEKEISILKFIVVFLPVENDYMSSHSKSQGYPSESWEIKVLPEVLFSVCL